ncbi:FG-GAP repeat protein [Symmachiella dynata]|uniref:FG-GAP-like repeat-containing protein n=1 Tax=Symmachiella dynata TaxID=2527995 RepID=UPI00118AD3F1|nr:FG-GAP-like repeat-containing protein [Symmachiella dynata]QDT46623.1 FG-GAP repeat protein [Symmachiella dynata]
MKQLSISIPLILLSFILLPASGADKTKPRATAKSNASGESQVFTPGASIPVSPQRKLTQIGNTEEFESVIMGRVIGTADVFGNGPYDLFLYPDRIFPIRGFDEDGTPYYGKVVKIKENHDAPMGGAILTGPDNEIYCVNGHRRKIRVSKFDRNKKEFQPYAESKQLNVPSGVGGGMAARINDNGKLDVYFSIPDGVPYRPAGPHHHSPAYIPYDGAGFWRGKIPRRMMYHARFDSPRLKKTETVHRSGEGPGEFLFSVNGMDVLNLGDGHPPGVVTTEKQSVLRFFPIDPATGELGPKQYVNNEDQVALRHSVINAAVKAIPDPKTGLSNLIVTDTGLVWFYPHTGQFADNGSPIYGAAQPVKAEGLRLALGQLPVISPGDMNGDGLVDLMAGNDAGKLLFVKNIGTKQRAEFDNPVAVMVGGKPLDIKPGYRGSIQGPGEAMWGYTCPTVCDWNGDGRQDVILNSSLGDYMLLLQEESTSDGQPVFSAPKTMYGDGIQLHLAWRNQPAVTDWGNDGPLCLIALDEKNLLRQFWRVDDQNVDRGELLTFEDGSPIPANVDEAAGQTGRAKLVAHDWDGDGDVDLLLGTSRGLSFPASKSFHLPSDYGDERAASILFLRNVGDNAHPKFEYIQQLAFDGERIKLGIHSCSPVPIDVGRGKIDLLCGEEQGSIRYFPRESLTVIGHKE